MFDNHIHVLERISAMVCAVLRVHNPRDRSIHCVAGPQQTIVYLEVIIDVKIVFTLLVRRPSTRATRASYKGVEDIETIVHVKVFIKIIPCFFTQALM